jgi:DNA-binding transcriptional LysR family regulator
MDEFSRIKTFIKVAESGSFSAAARDVASVSSIARQVKSLEDELGVRLFNRSTRKLALTDAGRNFFERVKVIVYDLNGAKAEAKSLHEEVRGALRVSLRVAAGTTVVIPALPRLLERHPGLMLDIILTDERRDLIANNIDVAMWLGDLPNADIVARRLSPSRRIVCASPAYLEKHGIPTNPSDLLRHQCLLFSAPTYRNRWSFTRDGRREEIEVTGNVRSDNGLILLSSSLASLGIVIVHHWMVRGLIAEGRLTRILSEYTINPRPGGAELYAVYPSSRQLSRRIRAFVDFLVEVFREAK